MSQERVEALAGRLVAEGVDAFFGWSETTLGYLFGYAEHAGHRFFTLGINARGENALICGALSENQARRAGIQDVRPWKDGEDPLRLFHDLAAQWDLKGGVIAVDEDMPALMLLKMQATLPAALFKDGGPLLADLRRHKKEDDLVLLRKASKIADETYEEVKPLIKAGMTERQVEKLLFEGMEKRGGVVNFGIIGTGAGGAEPHHVTGDDVLREGDVVILDFGCDVQGYRSDITRTVAVGHASDRAKEVYKIVYDAHVAGRSALAPKAIVGDVDAAARAVIEKAGFGPQFMHRLGHGIGLMAHEEPYLIPGGKDALRPGDCFSIEPGIYLGGEFGVRIENLYTVNADGWESFNAEPPSEIEVVG